MDELTFLDIAILHRIDEDTHIEKFGSRINTSFFETANLMGTMKIKGLIDFEQSIGGNSKVTLTSKGKYILEIAERKSKEELDTLDIAILENIGKGASNIVKLKDEINIREEDLAFHIEKLYVQSYVDYYIRSAELYLNLTEKGFNKTGGIKKVKVEETKEQVKEEEESQKEEIQTKLIDAEEDVMTKRARTKREYYLKKNWVYILLVIILVLIITGVIYIFFII